MYSGIHANVTARDAADVGAPGRVPHPAGASSWEIPRGTARDRQLTSSIEKGSDRD
ncbi:hypothetical protein [Cellulomonas edaphi]|uniref:Uncharacterized protein n=1 Tax=Cellulomonas edaphi TaxID=3053468 RepID=A0ABT7S3I9_9CELL|nr:hypothetical protein [Cellulomons edaphi]MDM7830186.1 hypothetical protein [Cellulomons edaphi]